MMPVGTSVRRLDFGSLPRTQLPPISVRVDLDQPRDSSRWGYSRSALRLQAHILQSAEVSLGATRKCNLGICLNMRASKPVLSSHMRRAVHKGAISGAVGSATHSEPHSEP